MAKKRHKHEEHVDESWLVPYADVLTLLLALFIVLFAMSSVDASKFKQMAISMNEEFSGGTGDEEFLAELEASEEAELREKEATIDKMVEQRIEEQKNKAIKAEMDTLKKVQDRIDTYIKVNNLNLSLKTSLTEQGLMITIEDTALFDLGKAEIKSDSIRIAKSISTLLIETMPRQIMVSGHTDNLPINNEEFKSNWELSTQRSINFLELMLKNKQLDAKKFSAIGYGEFRPVAENNTEKGKAKNRRVEVLVLPLMNSFDPSSNIPK